MNNEMEQLQEGVKDAEALYKLALGMVADGQSQLDPEVASGLHALKAELKESKEVLHG